MVNLKINNIPVSVEEGTTILNAAAAAGVSAEAMAQEVSRALRNRLRKEKKQQERRDLAPAAQLQPKARSLRYDNIRSARAEEGVLRLLLLDPALLSKMAGLEGQEFSSPLLGRAFDALRGQVQQGLSPNLAPLAQIFTGEEMDHLAQVASQPESAANGPRALADYISIIRGEGLRRSQGQGDDLLLAMQKKYQKSKAYMEEKP